MDHHSYINAVHKIVISHAAPELHQQLTDIKLAYGMGDQTMRGVTYFGRWQNGTVDPIPFVEVCASGEESLVQIAGTILHELAHVVVGEAEGHSPIWKQACKALGLRRPYGGGQQYLRASFVPSFRDALTALGTFDDGTPLCHPHFKPRQCSLGIGRLGGKSRGLGSGSRLRKWICDCEPPVIIRASRDDLACHCDHCGAAFNQPN